jgi:hypothetical protein
MIGTSIFCSAMWTKKWQAEASYLYKWISGRGFKSCLNVSNAETKSYKHYPSKHTIEDDSPHHGKRKDARSVLELFS